MALSEALSEAITRQDIDAVENEWLAAVEQQPDQLDDFIRAAEILERQGHGAKANALLEVLDDQLREQGFWSLRLDMLRAVGKRYVKQGNMFETVQSTIRAMYGDRQEQLEILLPAVGLDGDKDETPKLWDKVERLRSLLVFEQGTVVAMKGKGVGEVTCVNLALQTLKVDFERQKGVSVGFRAAGKMLTVLPEDHVLTIKHTDPAALKQLKPAELLQKVLQSYDHPLTGAEVKEVVRGVVPISKWTSWWTSARRHPQVLTSGKGKQKYSWADTGADAADAIWTAFEDADLEGRLKQFRRAANQDAELIERMVTLLRDQATEMIGPDTPLLPTGLMIWSVIEKHLPEDTSLDPATALAEVVDVQQLLSKIDSARTRDRVLDMIRETRDDWTEIYSQRFPAETDNRSLRLIASAVFGEGDAAREQLLDRVLAQPSKAAAAFTWLAEQAAEDDAIRSYRPLRLLKQLLVALADESFSDYRNRLSPMCDSGGTVPKILAVLDRDDAADALMSIERARGIEDYQRDPLVTSIYLRFPDLDESDDEPIYALPATYAQKREELRQLLESEIPENRRAIEVAREMGDLRENFEYKSARQRHEYLTARATELSNQLDSTVVLRVETVNPDQVRVGTVTTLGDNDGSTRKLTILGPWESDPDEGVISHESEQAARMLGRKIGDYIELNKRELEIVAIEKFVD